MPTKAKKVTVPVEAPIEDKPKFVPVEVKEEKVENYTAEDLDNAAKVLMRAFPDHIALAVEQASIQRNIPIWQEVCSLVYYCFNGGLMYTGYLDPAWDSGAPILQPSSICGYCGKTYTPKWRRQLFCSNECGSAAARKN